MLADLKRVTDLFVEGTEVVFAEDTEHPVLLWVNKLNSFQKEECQRDGSAARSRTILAVKEHGSPEYLAFEASLSELDDDGIRERILDMDNSQRFVEAMGAMRRDEDWNERIEAASRPSDDMTEEERATVMKINGDYADALQALIDERRDAAKMDLMALDTESLREKYRESWLAANAFTSFQREYAKTQLLYAVRSCKATKVDGAWDHSGCDGHEQRALDSREEVPRLPDGLLTQLLDAARAISVDQAEARFSDAPRSSSASSAQPNEEAAASTPSTPEVTSPELVPTS